MQPVKIFAQLLNEGTDCWRPVSATERSDGVFEILGTIPAGEEWQYGPGVQVQCIDKVFADGSTGLIASKKGIIQRPESAR